MWMRDYPSDFVAPGTVGALSAFIKQILKQSHTLGHGSDFLPFVEMLPTLTDNDIGWALKVEESVAESDESDSMFDDDDSLTTEPDSNHNRRVGPSVDRTEIPKTLIRERKPSLPFSSMSLISTSRNETGRPRGLSQTSMKEIMSKLNRASHMTLIFDSESIANEITRGDAELFLRIKVCSCLLLPFDTTHCRFSRGIGYDTQWFKEKRILKLTISSSLAVVSTF